MINKVLHKTWMNGEEMVRRLHEPVRPVNRRRVRFIGLLGPALIFSISLGAQSPGATSRDRFNVPYPPPEMTLISGNLTSKSAIDIKGITNQFVLLAGVVFNPDYQCSSTFPFNTVNGINEYMNHQAQVFYLSKAKHYHC